MPDFNHISFIILLFLKMIEYKEESKFWDWNIQTDITLSDMTNFETYKDWYVNDCWTAFANFAKFRKDIVKTIKDEYITKSTMVSLDNIIM